MSLEDPTTGDYVYGDGIVETRTISGGAKMSMTAAIFGVEPYLVVGANGGAGTVSVSGAGSVLQLVGTGESYAWGEGVYGAAASIGSYGGAGTLDVSNGGSFKIVDSSRAPILDPDWFGTESVDIGRGSGGNGMARVDGKGSTFAIIGGAPYLEIGRDQGIGRMLVDHGASFALNSVTKNDPKAPFGTSEAGISIGRENGAEGTLTLDHGSTGKLTSGAGSDASIQVGRDMGTGTLNLLGGSSLSLNGDAGALLLLGRSAGDGSLNMAGGSQLVVHGTSDFAVVAVGDFDYSDSSFGGGSGRATIIDSSISLDSGSNSVLLVGAGDWEAGEAGADGTLDARNSSFVVAGAGHNGFSVGIDAGTGYASLKNKTVVEVSSTGGSANLNVGSGGSQGASSFGQLNVEDSEIRIIGTGSAGANSWFGSDGAVADFRLTDGRLSISSATYSSLDIGLDGGAALVDIGGGSSISMTTTSTDPGLGGLAATIGSYWSTAVVTLHGGANWDFTSVFGAGLMIGTNWASDGSDSGSGTLLLKDRSRINFQSSGDSSNSLVVGGGEGSYARLQVSGGSVIDLDLDGSADSWADLQIGLHGADTATVLVDGRGSKIDHVDIIRIGLDLTDGFGTSGGQRTLTIKNGGVVNAETVEIGEGGALGGYRGTLNSEIVHLLDGGSIELQDGQFGDFTISSRVVVANFGTLSIDIGSGGRQDTLKSQGFESTGGQLSIVLNSVGAYHFAANETRALVDVNGGMPTVYVTGQGAGFGYYSGSLASDPDATIYFKALNPGSSGAKAIAVLDFGTAGAGANVVYESDINSGLVKGGAIYGPAGGVAYNVDQFLGTNSADTMTATGETALLLTFDGRDGADTITGGVGIDTIFGGAGKDVLGGGAGNDMLNGDADADELNGDAGADRLNGGAGADILRGGEGADIMRGGADNDIYYVDDASDLVVEGDAEGTADTVLSLVTYSLASGAQVEVLRTTEERDPTEINLTGNRLHQAITGNVADNTLNDGGAGAADTMTGLDGNDVYRIFNSGDVIVEVAGQGTADRVTTSVNYKLGAGVEIEIMTTNGSTGKTNINLSGNEFGQEMTGNSGDNRLEGKGGNDTLRGLGGNDTFVFATELGPDNVDTVLDFNVADDRFLLSDVIFKALNPGTLAGSAFRANTTGLAGDTNDRIIYETDTGKLFYDADGSNAGDSILFAIVGVNLALTKADFSVA